MKVLLLEDTPEHAELIEHALAEARGSIAFELTRTARLADMLARAEQGGFDVALIDLMVPDSHGLETYRTLHARAPDLPVVVVSAMSDEQIALAAVREGAQDYLVKDSNLIDVVPRALRYAFERKKVQSELERAEAARAAAEEQLRQERELRELERLSAPGATSVTARAFGQQRLNEAVPERFADLVLRYGAMIEQALEQRTYKVEHRLSDGLRALAEEIGGLHGGARDVIELHTTALRRTIAEAAPRRAQAYIDEARVMVLELMGYLVGYYRG